jgi:hypothetical protein
MLRILLVTIMMNLGVGSALLPLVSSHNHNSSAEIAVTSSSTTAELGQAYMTAGYSHEGSHDHSENSHSHDCSKCSNHCHSSHCFQMLQVAGNSFGAFNAGLGLYVDYEMVIPDGIASSPFRPPIV